MRRSDGDGRVPAVEVMIATAYIRDCIINCRTRRALIRDAIAAGTSQYGMQTFDQSLYDLFQAGLINYETLSRAPRTPTNSSCVSRASPRPRTCLGNPCSPLASDAEFVPPAPRGARKRALFYGTGPAPGRGEPVSDPGSGPRGVVHFTRRLSKGPLRNRCTILCFRNRGRDHRRGASEGVNGA